MNEFNIAIGKRIRKLREEHGYTREKLSELAGINDKFLYEVEIGKKGISSQKLFMLSRSLNVTMDYIVHGNIKNVRKEIVNALLNELNDAQLKNMECIIRNIIAISKNGDS